jgi:TPR repeat protein
VQNNPASEDGQERSAARAALLTAARTVAERDGVESVTLSKVAGEAGVPRAAVYGQFARKEDLLMSIVSDDLAALARSMQGIDWPQGGETPESAVILSLPRPADTAPAEAPAEMIDVAKDVSAALAATPVAEAPQPRQRLTRRTELTQVLDTKPAAEESEAKPAEGPRAPDAWLERRLRTFERGVSGLEARQEQVEKNARAAAVAAQETIKALEATVLELKERADAAEAKLKSSANETRLALNETSLRLQTVEGVARAALAENTPAEAPASEPVAEIAAPVPEPVVAAAPTVSPEEASADTAPKSFIAGVRKSVVAATAAAEAEAKAKVEVTAQTGRSSMTRYLIGGLIVLVVFVAAASVAFSKGVSDGRREAMTHMTRIAALVPAVVAAHETSLDQLTARARGGDAVAQLQVGLRYLNATPKDKAAALHWVGLAAVHGQPVAQYVLATLDAPTDPARALQWYEAAALQGNRKAMHALAVAYAEGLGTAKSPSEAARWFSRAAGFGYVDSQFNLAVLYERGDGVPQSLLDAFKWYAVAARQGDVESKSRVDALRTQLNGDDLAAAEHAADVFKPLPVDVAANTVR